MENAAPLTQMLYRSSIGRPGWLALGFVALLALAAMPESSAFSTVVVDAGHGGQDRGGVPWQRYPEKTFALDMAKRVDQLLRNQGYRTVMTRTTDTYLSLARRAEIANRQKDAVFVSLHFNASRNRDAAGLETFYYSGEGYRLASNIQRRMMRVNRNEDRGVKKRGFYVLRKTRIPAVLVECGFLTNHGEQRLCLDKRYRQRLAEQIVEGIVASDPTPRTRGGASRYTVTMTAKPAPPPATPEPVRTLSSEGPQVVTNATNKQFSSYSKHELRTMFLNAKSRY